MNSISVVGMGGLRETTLAKKVYDNKRVVERFVCHAWIIVSQSIQDGGGTSEHDKEILSIKE